MKILVFEWLVGGGLLAEQIAIPASLIPPTQESPHFAPIASLLNQGAAMAVAAATDFAQAGMRVVLPVDHRLVDHPALSQRTQQVDIFNVEFPAGNRELFRQQFQTLVADADRVLLIAPETDNLLLNTMDWIEPKKRIGPDRDFVALTSNKPQFNSFLLQNHFDHVPEQWTVEAFTREIDSPNDAIGGDVWPVVLKPIDGAGTDSTWLVPDTSSYFERLKSIGRQEQFFVQRFVEGHPISVSVIAGDNPVILPPTEQVFDDQPFGHFTSARYPIPASLSDRARHLAEKLLDVLPPTTGYFGIDMIVSDSHLIQDWVVEVNPRLTMSYSTLREIVGFNLAAAMLSVQRINDETN